MNTKVVINVPISKDIPYCFIRIPFGNTNRYYFLKVSGTGDGCIPYGCQITSDFRVVKELHEKMGYTYLKIQNEYVICPHKNQVENRELLMTFNQDGTFYDYRNYDVPGNEKISELSKDFKNISQKYNFNFEKLFKTKTCDGFSAFIDSKYFPLGYMQYRQEGYIYQKICLDDEHLFLLYLDVESCPKESVVCLRVKQKLYQQIIQNDLSNALRHLCLTVYDQTNVYIKKFLIKSEI